MASFALLLKKSARNKIFHNPLLFTSFFTPFFVEKCLIFINDLETEKIKFVVSQSICCPNFCLSGNRINVIVGQSGHPPAVFRTLRELLEPLHIMG